MNAGNEISRIEDELGEIVETGTVDVTTFSSNCITNITEYDIEGNQLNIKNAIIDAEVKKYVEFQND